MNLIQEFKLEQSLGANPQFWLLLSVVLNWLAGFLDSIYLVPQIFSLVSAQTSRGLSFGVMLFIWLSTWFTYQSQTDFDLVEDLFHYSPVIGLSVAYLFFWITKKEYAIEDEVEQEEKSVTKSSTVKLDPLIWVYLLFLGLSVLCWYVAGKYFHLPYILNTLWVLGPALAFGPPACQILHMRGKSAIVGFSTWTPVLIITSNALYAISAGIILSIAKLPESYASMFIGVVVGNSLPAIVGYSWVLYQFSKNQNGKLWSAV